MRNSRIILNASIFETERDVCRKGNYIDHIDLSHACVWYLDTVQNDLKNLVT